MGEIREKGSEEIHPCRPMIAVFVHGAWVILDGRVICDRRRLCKPTTAEAVTLREL